MVAAKAGEDAKTAIRARAACTIVLMANLTNPGKGVALVERKSCYTVYHSIFERQFLGGNKFMRPTSMNAGRAHTFNKKSAVNPISQGFTALLRGCQYGNI
jgi:hypothetical protein